MEGEPPPRPPAAGFERQEHERWYWDAELRVRVDANSWFLRRCEAQTQQREASTRMQRATKEHRAAKKQLAAAEAALKSAKAEVTRSAEASDEAEWHWLRVPPMLREQAEAREQARVYGDPHGK